MAKTIKTIEELATRSELLSQRRIQREHEEAVFVEPKPPPPRVPLSETIRLCAECGNSFRPIHGHQLICSDRCRRTRRNRSSALWHERNPEADRKTRERARNKRRLHRPEETLYDNDMYLHPYQMMRHEKEHGYSFVLSYRDVLRREHEIAMHVVEMTLRYGTPVSSGLGPHRHPFKENLDLLDFQQQRALEKERERKQREKERRESV